MCGIVGLFLKDPALEPELGSLLADMLEVMTERGPDSAGIALYGAGQGGTIKLTLRAEGNVDFPELAATVGTVIGADCPVLVRGSHAVLTVPAKSEAAARAELANPAHGVSVVSGGRAMEIYKDVGLPAQVALRFGLGDMGGTHGIGHTRMATESAVTINGAHPFSTGLDQCLVHNGSLSNHNSVRRMLIREGLSFATENDSEVAAGYITWRLREGASLEQALTDSLDELDGFYTFVVGTEKGFAVLRDPIACKPAVMAETDQYVAFGSEYRVLASLPGVDTARVFEPEPARVYVWEH